MGFFLLVAPLFLVILTFFYPPPRPSMHDVFPRWPQKGGHLGFFTAEFSHFFNFFTAEFGHFLITNFQIFLLLSLVT
jgi:hypothetical protein